MIKLNQNLFDLTPIFVPEKTTLHYKIQQSLMTNLISQQNSICLVFCFFVFAFYVIILTCLFSFQLIFVHLKPILKNAWLIFKFSSNTNKINQPFFFIKGYINRFFEWSGCPGVYVLYSLKNEKVYIGRTQNLGRRLYQHLRLLKTNNHPCIELQKDFNLYGSSMIVDLPFPRDLDNNLFTNSNYVKIYEAYLIDSWGGHLYNTNTGRMIFDSEDD